MALTARALRTLKPGHWVTESARGEGQLRAKGGKTGVWFYFRYRRPDNTADDLPIGRYDAAGRDGLTLDQAKERANGWRLRWKRGERNLRDMLAIEQRSREAASDVRGSATLGKLLDAYSDQLERASKPSARSVRAELHHHVREAWPILWSAPLVTITTDDLLSVVAAPADAGHLRQAEKVRAYLRAAFAAGMKARHNAKALPALRALRVTANPARDLTPIEGANKARDRALSLAELRAYWQRIQGTEHAALRFHLLTGCQRIEQLRRTVAGDIDVDTQSLRLLDPKGRRSRPRVHYVPLLPAAMDALHDMCGDVPHGYLFTLTAGGAGATYHAISRHVSAVASAMLDADDLPGGTFTPGDLRRTVETRLADAGVSRDVRAHLQSHGLGGVQERHYDRHDYLPETRAALETMYDLLTAE